MDPGPPDLTIRLGEPLPGSLSNQYPQPVYQSQSTLEQGESLFKLYRLEGHDEVHISNLAVYKILPEHIFVHPAPRITPDWLEGTLLGGVLAYWLEKHGVYSLHATAVSVGSRALAFLASDSGGKTTLAAVLMQSGCSLLSDNLLPIEESETRILASPSYPNMRMWPAEAQYFVDRQLLLEPVVPGWKKLRVPVGEGGFGTYRTEDTPLVCIYLPQRRDSSPFGQVEITPLSPQHAAIELMRHIYLARLAALPDLAAPRLQFCTRIGQILPVRLLSYPSGLEHLSAVRQAILDDLETLGFSETLRSSETPNPSAA